MKTLVTRMITGSYVTATRKFSVFWRRPAESGRKLKISPDVRWCQRDEFPSIWKFWISEKKNTLHVSVWWTVRKLSIKFGVSPFCGSEKCFNTDNRSDKSTWNHYFILETKDVLDYALYPYITQFSIFSKYHYIVYTSNLSLVLYLQW